jgi:hypothetical protein
MPVRYPANALCLGLLCAALVAGCASLTQPWQAPAVALAGLRVKEITLARQTFVVTLAVKNPNDRALPITAMTYRIQIEGSEVVQGATALDRQVPAFGEALVDVEVAGSLFGLLEQLPSLALEDRPRDWIVSGTVTIAGLLTLPYRYSGRVDARQLLSRTVTGFVSAPPGSLPTGHKPPGPRPGEPP